MNKYNFTQIQESLENLQKPKLSSQLINNSKEKVWSNLSSSILKQSSMTPQTPPTKSQSWKNFLSRPQYLLAGSTLVLVIVVAMVALRFNFLNQPQTSVEAAVSIPELRSRADKKLSTLTNGVSLTTLKSTVETVKAPQPSNVSTNSSSSTKPSESQNNSTTTFVNSEKAKEIVEKEQIKDDVVFYTETEMQYLGDSSAISSTYTGLDITKPTVQKLWMSANYYKSVTYNDGKIVDFFLSTPEFSLTYLGGKYAVKEVYSDNNYFGGFGFGATSEYSPRNMEIEFLKYLLDENNQFNDLGMKTVDGKNLRVIEVKYDFSMYPTTLSGHQTLNESSASTTQETIVKGDSSDTSYSTEDSIDVQTKDIPSDPSIMPPVENYSTRYYIDQSSLSLYLTEELVDDKVTMTSKQLASQTYQNQDIQNFFHSNELGNIEIRDVVINYPSPEAFTLASFIKDFDLFYFESINTDYISATNQAIYAKYSGSNHYSDPDFNPYIATLEESTTIYYQTSLANYYQEFVSTEILDQKPDYSTYLYDYSKKQNERQIKVSLDGKTIPATYFEIVYNYPEAKYEDQYTDVVYPASSETNIFIEFQFGNYWYKITAWQDSTNSNIDPLKLDIVKLTKMTPEKAKEIDDKAASLIIENPDSYSIDPTPTTVPETLFDGKFTDISKDLRWLPGDLSAEYKLQVTSLEYSKGTTKGDCSNQMPFIYPHACIVSGYGGIKINYSDNTQSASLDNNSFEYGVVNIEMAKLDFVYFEESYRDTFASSASFKDLSDGVKVLTQEGGSMIIFAPKGEQTLFLVTATGGKIDQTSAIKILQGVQLDKDIDILQKQLDKYLSLRPVTTR